jgi:hypothetical protein
MAKIDASKSAIDNLLALVNAANTGQTITNAQVTAGTPAAQTADGQGRNTNVQLTAVAGQGYTGNVTVTYARRGLNDSVLSPNFNSERTVGDTASAIIAAIAATNGLVASELHLEDPGTPGTPVTGAINNSPAHLNLVSANGSLLYIDGSSQSITFTWDAQQVALSTAVATTALAGFDAAS